MKSSITRLLVFALATIPALRAQFTSGSTGSDGALNLTAAGIVVFDPTAMGLNPAGDNVFNFTTINIAQGTIVVMTAATVRNKPVIWLATGNVTIAGTLNLSGANGATMSASNPGLTRSPAMPGPGGFPGGVGGYLSSPATNGGGLGGGAAGTMAGAAGVYSYNSATLVPLVGGSGGAGGALFNADPGGNGGAGGGAIRIVSSTSIAVTGTIEATGGSGSASPSGGYAGGSGSGGAIHLIAPTVTGAGILWIGGFGGGVVKINATTDSYVNTINYGVPTTGPLYNPPLPSAVPSVTVVSVNGIAAPGEITASSQAPDFTVNTPNPVAVNIAAQYIPVGTVVKLYLTSEFGNDSVVTCAALAGTLVSSTATCAGASLPQGVTITDVVAVW